MHGLYVCSMQNRNARDHARANLGVLQSHVLMFVARVKHDKLQILSGFCSEAPENDKHIPHLLGTLFFVVFIHITKRKKNDMKLKNSLATQCLTQ